MDMPRANGYGEKNIDSKKMFVEAAQRQMTSSGGAGVFQAK